MGKYLIHRATKCNVPVLLPLIEKYWHFENISGFDSQCIAIQLSRLLSEPHLGCGWIALEEDLAVGYLLAVYVFSLEHQGLTAEIDEFFVSQKQRGQGVGIALIEAAESEFIRAGCVNVSLQLSRGNSSARAFYVGQGYGERSNFELLEKTLHL